MSRSQPFEEAKEVIQTGGTSSPKSLRHELVGTVKDQRGGASVRDMVSWLGDGIREAGKGQTMKEICRT